MEVTEGNVTTFYSVPISRAEMFISDDDLIFVKRVPILYRTLSRPWLTEYLTKNTSRPYWSEVFMNVYGDYAINFVCPIFLNDSVAQWRNTSLYAPLDDRPFIQIDQLYGLVGVQFTVSYLTSFLRNITNGRPEQTFIMNKKGQILGHSSRMYANENNIARSILDNGLLRNDSGSFRYNHELMVTTARIYDDYGLDWAVVVVSMEKSFVAEMLTSGVVAFVLFILQLMVQPFIVFIILHYISHNLYSIVRNMTKFLSLQGLEPKDEHKESKSFLTEIYEMNHTLNTLRNGLASLSKYVPHIFQKRLSRTHSVPEDITKVGMKPRNMTVMFCGIVGFTEIAETANHVVFLNVVSEFFETVCRIAETHNGVVDKIIEGSVMVLFNEDHHEVCACRAALDILESLSEFEMKWKECNFPKLQVTFGINSGEMLCGCMGSNNRLSFTAIGDNVNIASRLQHLARTYSCSIFIGENTFEALSTRGNEFLCFFVDFIRLKGKKHPTSVYCLRKFETDASEVEHKISSDLDLAKQYILQGEFFHVRQVCEKLVTLDGTCTITCRLQQRSLELIAKVEHCGMARSRQFLSSDCISYPSTLSQ
ncbi:hypothetical protein C9374_004440 [Naegleria lovaniensis]|uniref:Guanylate cyclase domain-containing protein n=1 Tax=Naegleria lovaniensis TaxID=51637 RepID=A0AA88KKK4_NAELO|nr:uncharacterized protein C9374_004440 [Naegleria lovaniensis]KAG2383103.1 hypothetical protein C9374_004440 [Naegleria lovaniensis]